MSWIEAKLRCPECSCKFFVRLDMSDLEAVILEGIHATAHPFVTERSLDRRKVAVQTHHTRGGDPDDELPF